VWNQEIETSERRFKKRLFGKNLWVVLFVGKEVLQAWQGKKNLGQEDPDSLSSQCVVKRKLALLKSNQPRDSRVRAGRTSRQASAEHSAEANFLHPQISKHSFCPAIP